MKILQITSTFLPVIGGQEKVVEELSTKLKKLKHDITILTTDLFCGGKNLPKEEKINGLRIVRCKNDFFLGGYGYSKETINWLKQNWKKYDVIHSHGYNRFLSEFAVYYLRKKRPVVFTPHGFIHTKKNYFFKIIHDLTIGRFIKYAKICTALTKLDFREYKKLGVKKEKIIELPNGINIENFKKINKKNLESFKKKYGLEKNIVLHVGRIHKSKGLNYLVKAIKELDVKLLIVGEDAGYKEELLKKIKRLGLADKIIFTGPLDGKNLSKAYLACDVFVLFSEWEGFGIVVIEAMAAGKPVIVSDRGSLPYLIEEDKTGLIVPFKNIKLLEKNIDFLLNNKKVAQTMGENGKKVAKDYDWNKIIKRYEEIYKSVK